MTTFVLSLLIGRNDYWGKLKWLSAILFGVMYMLAEYATFSAANMTEFGATHLPDFGLIFDGGILAVLGLGFGTGIRHIVRRAKNNQAQQ